MRDALRPALAAVTFLTAAPIGRRTEIGPPDLRRAVGFFPLVGALVSALTGGVAWVAALVLPPLPAAALGVAAGVALTGAMHLDGLADTADGVGASLSGEDPSTAMHDPRLGVWGVAAVALDLLLRVSVLGALVSAGPTFPVEAIAAGVLGRSAAIAMLIAVPYAGGEAGTGGWTRGASLGASLVGLVVAPALALLLVGPVTTGGMVAVGVVATLLVARWSRRRLGGVTGDTLGAGVELTETLALTATLAFR